MFNFAPIFGVYEFRLKSLRLGAAEAKEYWENLDFCPLWLHYYPPWYDLGLNNLREQIRQFP